MAMRYLPGPWETSTLATTRPDKEWTVVLPGGGDMLADLTGCPNAEAHCNLMAEAPALHAALRGLVAWVNSTGIVNMPAFAGMNLGPLAHARGMSSRYEPLNEIPRGWDKVEPGPEQAGYCGFCHRTDAVQRHEEDYCAHCLRGNLNVAYERREQDNPHQGDDELCNRVSDVLEGLEDMPLPGAMPQRVQKLRAALERAMQQRGRG